MKKKMVLILCFVIVFSSLVFISSFAAGTIHSVQAYINDTLKITLNGEDFTPLDEDGSKLTPILYNDRTYLPVRAISNAFGKKIDWDASTNTVVIGDANNPIDEYRLEASKKAETTYEISYVASTYLEGWKNELKNLVETSKRIYVYKEDADYFDQYYKAIDDYALSCAYVTSLAFTDTNEAPSNRTYGTAMGYSSTYSMANIYREGFFNLLNALNPISSETMHYDYIFEAPVG